MSEADEELYNDRDRDTHELRRELPDEVYAAEADYVRLAMKEMTARRMIGWLRAFAEYSKVAGHTKSAEHAWAMSNRLAHEVEHESVDTDWSAKDGEEEVSGDV